MGSINHPSTTNRPNLTAARREAKVVDGGLRRKKRKNTHILYKKGRESRTIQGARWLMRQVTYWHSSRRGRAAPRASSEGL